MYPNRRLKHTIVILKLVNVLDRPDPPTISIKLSRPCLNSSVRKFSASHFVHLNGITAKITWESTLARAEFKSALRRKSEVYFVRPLAMSCFSQQDNISLNLNCGEPQLPLWVQQDVVRRADIFSCRMPCSACAAFNLYFEFLSVES
jgi:hypothetical protein